MVFEENSVGSRRVRVVLSAKPREDLLYSFGSCRVRFTEDDTSRNDNCNFAAGSCITLNSELAADASSSLSHSLQPEMSILPLIQDGWVDAFAIVNDLQREVVGITEFDFQSTAIR